MDWTTWFRHQLHSSGEGFAWAFEQLPADRQLQLPPRPTWLGEWPAARHVWHVMEYERCLVIPSMRQWLGGPLPDVDSYGEHDQSWSPDETDHITDLASRFRAIRAEQVLLLDALEDADWSAPRETIWGEKPLSMILTKTYQHTFEHGDPILRMGLWWDEILADLAEAAAADAIA